MNRSGYQLPASLYEDLNLKKWEAGQIHYKTKAVDQTVDVFLAPRCENLAVDWNYKFFYLRKPEGNWIKFNNIYSLLRHMVHQRRKYAREVPNLEQTITNLDNENAVIVQFRKDKIGSDWARQLRRRLEIERRKLLRAQDKSKKRALWHLCHVVRVEVPIDEDPDFLFGIDSLGRVNGGMLGASEAAASRALRERIYVITQKSALSAPDEAYITQFVLELERCRDEAVQVGEKAIELVKEFLDDSKKAFERTLYYHLNRLHWLVERLWPSPYDRAKVHLHNEIAEIRMLIETDKGKYRRDQVTRDDWSKVLGFFEVMLNSLRLQKVRGQLEQLLLPLAEGQEGGLMGAECDAVGVQMDKQITQAELIDDSGFERPKMPHILTQLRLAREEVRGLSKDHFKRGRKIIKRFLDRNEQAA